MQKQFDKINNLFVKRFKDYIYELPMPKEYMDFDLLRVDNFPWLKLDLLVPVREIHNEILNVEHLLVNHRDIEGEHVGWRSFSIYGKSYDTTTAVNDTRPSVWTEQALEHMPFTVNYFKTVFPCKNYSRVRVMALGPGGYISLHNDTEDSKLAPVNISITQPEGCDFVMENAGVIPFEPGSAFWLDVSRRHTVYNNSNSVRYHLIVHQRTYTKAFKQLALKSYKNLYKKG